MRVYICSAEHVSKQKCPRCLKNKKHTDHKKEEFMIK